MLIRILSVLLLCVSYIGSSYTLLYTYYAPLFISNCSNNYSHPFVCAVTVSTGFYSGSDSGVPSEYSYTTGSWAPPVSVGGVVRRDTNLPEATTTLSPSVSVDDLAGQRQTTEHLQHSATFYQSSDSECEVRRERERESVGVGCCARDALIWLMNTTQAHPVVAEFAIVNSATASILLLLLLCT